MISCSQRLNGHLPDDKSFVIPSTGCSDYSVNNKNACSASFTMRQKLQKQCVAGQIKTIFFLLVPQRSFLGYPVLAAL